MDNYTGKRLDGRYEIQEVIGVGGMAVVYKAYDNIDDRIVAVKILKDEYLANEEFRRRFKNESKAIAVLSHPNIVKVFNVSYGDRLQYIVMEYVEGITLKEYIEQQGKLGIKETVHFTMQILRALQHAHDKGIVHRDIKPQNIMLLSNGNIKVTDFGIARFSYSDTKTMTDSAIGSVHYISPEQARGGATDDRADIYSVGVVMYEMLTGQVPFQSDNSVSVALMQLQNEAKKPRELNNNIPVGLEQIVIHAMRKNARERYQSAAEMLLDIEEFKRNPTIRFQKDYFVDNDPTKYVNKKPDIPKTVVAPPVVPPAAPPVEPGFGLEDDEDDDQSGTGSRVGAIVIGVLVGLVLTLVISIAVLWIFKPHVIDSLPIINGIFKAQNQTVENFVDKECDKIINDSKYTNYYEFVIVEQPKSDYENGKVFAQSPEPDSPRKADEIVKVTLYVANNNKKVIVPDLEEENWEQAQRILEDMGFKVSLIPDIDLHYANGTVIKTEPSGGSEVAEGSKIMLYYAKEPTKVPVADVMDMDVETAKELILSQGLKPNVVEEESDKKQGTVIGQSPESGEPVLQGQEVTLTVSSGVPPSAEATITFNLPSKGTKGTLEVYISSELVKEATLLLDGSSYDLKVTGSGESKLVKIRFDNRDYYSCIVNFNSNPPTVTSGSYASLISGSSGRMPSVVGLDKDTAVKRLNDAGFWNIEFTYTVVLDPTQEGVILSQNPAAPNQNTIIIPSYSHDQKITLEIAMTEGV
ncbi:MAG: Stk1 family PASTA domain-containing Ser/Thr kinase [Clostridia bacterium]|nr:Stk1 family PASTA domain-containing Ser/Thr kinase [Clostridia bacterium]